jgi:hypothetical protein
MTYALGLLQEGVSAIITDNRVSTRFESDDIALKSGFLFDGCVYGASGNADAIKSFVGICRRYLGGLSGPEDCWTEFLQVAKFHAFGSSGPFQILLSSRHDGEPKLFILDSRCEDIGNARDGDALGSGAEFLNDTFTRIHNRAGPSVARRANEIHGLPLTDYPYLYTLLLMERVKGTEVSQLHRVGVGGVFSFVYQTSEGEWFQRPALYIIHSCRHKHLWVYRVAFEGNALVIHDGDLPRPRILVNASDNHEVLGLDEDALQNWGGTILNHVAEQESYYFCGVGFADTAHRGNNLVGLWNEKEPMFSPKDGGQISQGVSEFITAVCTGQLGL